MNLFVFLCICNQIRICFLSFHDFYNISFRYFRHFQYMSYFGLTNISADTDILNLGYNMVIYKFITSAHMTEKQSLVLSFKNIRDFLFMNGILSTPLVFIDDIQSSKKKLYIHHLHKEYKGRITKDLPETPTVQTLVLFYQH